MFLNMSMYVHVCKPLWGSTFCSNSGIFNRYVTRVRCIDTAPKNADWFCSDKLPCYSKRLESCEIFISSAKTYVCIFGM